MSDSVRPHGLQPTRLLHPWDSPGKNTGVGCHFLLQCMKVESESVSDSQQPHGLQPIRLLHPWDFPGNSTGVGCHCLLPYIHIYPLFWILIMRTYIEQRKLYALLCGDLNGKGIQKRGYMCYTSILISQFVSPPLPTLLSICSFSMSVSHFFFGNKFICIVFLDSTYK